MDEPVIHDFVSQIRELRIRVALLEEANSRNMSYIAALRAKETPVEKEWDDIDLGGC